MEKIYAGNTPASVKLKVGSGFFSKSEYQVKFSSPGYDDRTVPVTFNIDGWYFGNIFIGGLLGMLIIDPAAGAMWKIDSEFLNNTLSESNASVDSEIQILDINKIPISWKSQLVKIN